MRANCKTIEETITAINEDKLFAVSNLGVKSLSKIRRLILEYGYAQASGLRKKEFLHSLVKMNVKKGA